MQGHLFFTNRQLILAIMTFWRNNFFFLKINTSYENYCKNYYYSKYNAKNNHQTGIITVTFAIIPINFFDIILINSTIIIIYFKIIFINFFRIYILKFPWNNSFASCINYFFRNIPTFNCLNNTFKLIIKIICKYYIIPSINGYNSRWFPISIFIILFYYSACPPQKIYFCQMKKDAIRLFLKNKKFFWRIIGI